MRLLIDAGNTRIKWAVADNAQDLIVVSGVVLDGDWSGLDVFVGKIESALLSCVAAAVTMDAIAIQVKQQFSVQLRVVNVSSRALGMVNGYADLDLLGVDRWVAALGARSLVNSGALIVVDAGTAVTIDLVSADNRFEGGVILPGLIAMHDALLGRTAGIESYLEAVVSVIGKNTRECVNSGIQYGLVGAIERVVAEILSTLESDDTRLLIMGGDANLIVVNSDLKFELQSNMIFYGLMLLSKK